MTVTLTPYSADKALMNLGNTPLKPKSNIQVYALFAMICWSGLLYPTVARPDCDEKWANDVLHGLPSLPLNLTRSKWAATPMSPTQITTPLALNAPFSKLEFKQRSTPLIKTEVGSFASLQPEITYIVDDINYYQMNTETFEEAYSSKYKRMPDERTLIQFYDTRFKIFQDGVYKVVTLISEIDAFKAAHFKNNITTQLTQMKGSLGQARQARGYDYKIKHLSELTRKMAGTIAEIYAFASLNHVQEFSVTLDQVPEFKQALQAKVADVKLRLKTDPHHLQTLKSHYPHLFRSFDYIDQVAEWMGTKEFDIVGDGFIIEVKRTAHALSFEQYTSPGPNGNKSYSDQLLEDVEFFRFLGLDYKIKLLSTGGYQQGLEYYIARDGITAI